MPGQVKHVSPSEPHAVLLVPARQPPVLLKQPQQAPALHTPWLLEVVRQLVLSGSAS